MTTELGQPDIVHEEGNFDEFLMSFYWEADGQEYKWSPRNEDIFQMFEMWFKSEDEGYEGGYGSLWQLFFITLTQIEGKDEAVYNNRMRGWKAKEHFLELVDEHGDEVVKLFEELVEDVRDEIGPTQEETREEAKKLSQFIEDDNLK